jgi:hypothetical protein
MLVDEGGDVYLTRKMSGRIELVEGTRTMVADF